MRSFQLSPSSKGQFRVPLMTRLTNSIRGKSMSHYKPPTHSATKQRGKQMQVLCMSTQTPSATSVLQLILSTRVWMVTWTLADDTINHRSPVRTLAAHFSYIHILHQMSVIQACTQFLAKVTQCLIIRQGIQGHRERFASYSGRGWRVVRHNIDTD